MTRESNGWLGVTKAASSSGIIPMPAHSSYASMRIGSSCLICSSPPMLSFKVKTVSVASVELSRTSFFASMRNCSICTLLPAVMVSRCISEKSIISPLTCKVISCQSVSSQFSTTQLTQVFSPALAIA